MKHLITSGCSFSVATSNTWTTHLAARLPEYNHIGLARGSMGNGLISRRVIHTVSELLKTVSHKDLLVGIMWSGPNRHDFYSNRVASSIPVNMMNSQENPTSVAGGRNWVILNHHWREPVSELYYSRFHDFTGQYVYTLEHILRVQWFLNLRRVNYFMTCFMDDVIPIGLVDDPECKHLYEQIDRSKFLPVSSEFSWCLSSGIPFPNDPEKDPHPGSDQHSAFVDTVVFPWIISKNLTK